MSGQPAWLQVHAGVHVHGLQVQVALPQPPSWPHVQEGPHAQGEQVQPGFSQTEDELLMAS